ncbi:uncharacterized protein BDV14DRAFT_184478 [Aspergillus stella-maris]|uniref:uncharacterized protein n=1 Tax=Aspergillus stella-maris TaxID=1810926 RepID=UPI003CCD41CF
MLRMGHVLSSSLGISISGLQSTKKHSENKHKTKSTDRSKETGPLTISACLVTRYPRRGSRMKSSHGAGSNHAR